MSVEVHYRPLDSKPEVLMVDGKELRARPPRLSKQNKQELRVRLMHVDPFAPMELAGLESAARTIKGKLQDLQVENSLLSSHDLADYLYPGPIDETATCRRIVAAVSVEDNWIDSMMRDKWESRIDKSLDTSYDHERTSFGPIRPPLIEKSAAQIGALTRDKRPKGAIKARITLTSRTGEKVQVIGLIDPGADVSCI